jgi:hypothetical protein
VLVFEFVSCSSDEQFKFTFSLRVKWKHESNNTYWSFLTNLYSAQILGAFSFGKIVSYWLAHFHWMTSWFLLVLRHISYMHYKLFKVFLKNRDIFLHHSSICCLFKNYIEYWSIGENTTCGSQRCNYGFLKILESIKYWLGRKLQQILLS